MSHPLFSPAPFQTGAVSLRNAPRWSTGCGSRSQEFLSALVDEALSCVPQLLEAHAPEEVAPGEEGVVRALQPLAQLAAAVLEGCRVCTTRNEIVQLVGVDLIVEQ
jgi:hypothetical protein